MDPVFLKVLVGTTLIAASSAVVGAFSFLKRQSLVGDAIAHALLPGVVLAFLLGNGRNPIYLILGALVAGLIAHYAIAHIEQNSKLKGDTATSLILSTFFGLGIALMSHVQRTGKGQQAGLDRFLLGKAAAITEADLYSFLFLALVLIAGVALFYKGFQLMTFNPDYAGAIGLPVQAIQLAFTVLTVLAITVGIQTVGVVLMAALLITPSVAARSWTASLPKMLLLAAAIAGLSAAVGTLVSSSLPKMPTGPWVVLVLGAFGFGSMLFAPEKGWLHRRARARANSEKTYRENVLKLLYQNEERGGEEQIVDAAFMREHREFERKKLKKAIRQLVSDRLLAPQESKFLLTDAGRKEGRRVVRLHRLWELYLTERLGMAADHIHPQAETMEHVITPELEAQLIKELGDPQLDPHQSPIPYEKAHE